MERLLNEITKSMDAVVEEWANQDYLQEGDLFVVGCSTSEVAGEHIGNSGSDEVAARIFKSLETLEEETGVDLVFQCCEHLNRALVVDYETAVEHGLTEVSVIPHRDAGGAMATHAFDQLDSPVVVEDVQARAGIDIGDTMIGMQLQKVAVPLRLKETHIGSARITGAYTRPKLIGGTRAKYSD